MNVRDAHQTSDPFTPQEPIEYFRTKNLLLATDFGSGTSTSIHGTTQRVPEDSRTHLWVGRLYFVQAKVICHSRHDGMGPHIG